MDCERFDVDSWIKTIDVWDSKYDYVMHNDHWLTSKYSANCEQCLLKGPIQSETIQDHEEQQKDTILSPAPKINQNLIPVTPIAPAITRSKPFVTPHSTAKFNDTFSRMTRQSSKKLGCQKELNETHLISLSETCDLYTSALAETPPVTSTTTSTVTKTVNHKTKLSPTPKPPGDDTWIPLDSTQANNQQQGNTITRQVSNKPMTNFEILMSTNHISEEPKSDGSSTNNSSRSSLSKKELYLDRPIIDNHQNDVHHNHEPHQQANSRIPRIPVRLSRP